MFLLVYFPLSASSQKVMQKYANNFYKKQKNEFFF